MDSTWFAIDIGGILAIFATSLGIYVALIVLVRLNGLRSFSKLSSHDFAITVAIGSVIASTVVAPTPSLAQGIVALVALFMLQRLLSSARPRFTNSPVDNRPLLLVREGQILDDNLLRARVTRADLYSKLRQANVFRLSDVRVVVMESTGDITVLHGDPGQLDDVLLEDVLDV